MKPSIYKLIIENYHGIKVRFINMRRRASKHLDTELGQMTKVISIA